MSAPGATALGEGTLLGGRYRLERRIGGGGMATVWLASDRQLGRAVAVKVLSDALAAQPEYRARFRREAKLAAGLSHPGLVRVFDANEEDGRPYLVMEHIAGPTLARRVAAGEGVDAERLARDLLGALTHIHGAGIVHRDVKPANVLFDRGGRAKLTDFGIARPDDATRLTQTGEVIGTLRYMAPEVIAGDPATARSDLYSAGVVLAETGDEGPPELRRLIASLRAVDPADRPPSAEAALARLDSAPTAPTARIRRGRELEIPLWAVLAALGAVAAAVIAVALIVGAGDSGGGSGTQRQTTHRATSGPGATHSTPTPAPAATTQPAPAPKPAKPAGKAKPAAPKPPNEGAIPPGREKHGRGPPPGHDKAKGG